MVRLSPHSQGLCCAIATSLQQSCMVWASCVDGGAGHTRRPYTLNGFDAAVRNKPEEEGMVFDVDPTVVTHKATVKGSDAEFKRLRSKAMNGLHVASMVFCSSLQSRVSGILVHIVDPVVQDSDKAITENKKALERSTPQGPQGRG